MDTKGPLQNKPQQALTNMKIVGFATEFGFIIALPLLAFVSLGKYLDSKFQQDYFVLIGVLVALVLSTIWLYKKIKDILHRQK